MQILLLAIFLLGLELVDEGKTEKSTRSIESENNLFWRNNIESSKIYQQVKDKNKNIKKYKEDNLSEDEILQLISDNSVPIDIEKWDAIGDRMIARANVSEETKRVVRQIKKQRPGIFWTLFRVTFETVNETRSIIQQISDIVGQNVVEEPVTQRSSPKTIPVSSTASADVTITNIDDMTTTTTEAPFKLSRKFLLDFVRRNIAGLVRLFNVEWKDAVNESQNSIKKFQKDLAKSVEPFLADNPNAY